MKERPQAVVFGAGKVACGLLGRLLFQSGYHSLFVARRREVIETINGNGGYGVNILNGGAHRCIVQNCNALAIADQRAVIDAVARAGIVFTAVGIDNLAAIAPIIAAGVWRRTRAVGALPLNVVACENLPGAGAYLRHQILSAAPADHVMMLDSVGGFSAAVTRQVMTGGDVQNGSITFNVEGESDLIIDANGLRSPLPQLDGARFTTEFSSMVTRKLFTLNCAHAVAAYLGYREGCRYMHEAAAHPRIAPVFRGAVAEAESALKAEFPERAADIEQEVAESLRQITDPRLADPVTRVARGPRRKLAPRERLVGPAKLACRHSLEKGNLCKAIAAALAYDDASDVEAVAMQRVIAEQGVQTVITEDCGLLPHEPLAQAIRYEWHRFKSGDNRGIQRVDENTKSLDRILFSVVSELSSKYDPEMVNEVVTRVGEQFKQARVWSYVPILIRKRVVQELTMPTR